MATFGSQPSSWNFWQEQESTNNQVATLATAPSTGVLQSISCFVAGNTMTSAPYPITFALWNGSTGALIAQSASFNVPVGSGSSGGQSYQTATMPATLITSGTSYYIGFWHGTLTAIEWSSNTSSGTFYQKTSASIGSMSGASTVAAAIGAFATYTPGGTFIRRSGAWALCPVKVRRSGAWVTVDAGAGTALVRRSGSWVP